MLFKGLRGAEGVPECPATLPSPTYTKNELHMSCTSSTSPIIEGDPQSRVR